MSEVKRAQRVGCSSGLITLSDVELAACSGGSGCEQQLLLFVSVVDPTGLAGGSEMFLLRGLSPVSVPSPLMTLGCDGWTTVVVRDCEGGFGSPSALMPWKSVVLSVCTHCGISFLTSSEIVSS